MLKTSILYLFNIDLLGWRVTSLGYLKDLICKPSGDGWESINERSSTPADTK